MAIEAGNFISENLSLYIDRWTKTSEFTEIARKYDLSNELARKLVSRDRKVTEDNLPMLHDIIRLAMKNRSEVHRRLLRGHKEAQKEVTVLA